MKTKSTSQSAFINLRLLLGLTLGSVGLALVMLAVKPSAEKPVPSEKPLPYMPVPGENPQDENAALTKLELYWFDRLTFPTGRFEPRWVRAAAAQHDRMQSRIPSGQHLKLDFSNPNALSTTGFTALGPQPERMTGCSGCFDYTLTKGR